MYIHGIEERLTHFYQYDPLTQFISRIFDSIPQGVYWTFNVTWWLLLAVALAFLAGEKWTLRILTLYGLVFIFELSHIIPALISWSYYPGLLSALVYCLVGIFYWRELIKTWKHPSSTEE